MNWLLSQIQWMRILWIYRKHRLKAVYMEGAFIKDRRSMLAWERAMTIVCNKCYRDIKRVCGERRAQASLDLMRHLTARGMARIMESDDYASS